MGLAPDTLTFDRANPLRAAALWCASLEYQLNDHPDDGWSPGEL